MSWLSDVRDFARGFTEFRAQKVERSETTEMFPKRILFNNLLGRDATALALYNEAYLRSSPVFICTTLLADGVARIPIIAVDKKTGEPLDEQNYLQNLLSQPNSDRGQKRYHADAVTYYAIGGDCYQYKNRNRYGIIDSLVSYNSSQIKPIRGERTLIEKYRYDSGDGYTQDINKNDIVPVSWSSVNFREPEKSVAPLLALAKEINLDNESLTTIISLYLNSLAPPFVMEMPPDWMNDTPTKTDFAEAKERLKTNQGGKNKGSAIIAQHGSKIYPLGISIKDAESFAAFLLTETRIAALFRVPVSYAGFHAGLDSSTFSNREEDARQFANVCLSHSWNICDAYTQSFRHEGFPDTKEYRIIPDVTKIPELQDTQKDIDERTRGRFVDGIITLDEARSTMRLDKDSTGNGDKYLWQIDPSKTLSDKTMEKLLSNGYSKTYS